ncbi:hypothetical protein ACFL1X_11315 [Candidatus Hydrogenedentota bacterium]
MDALPSCEDVIEALKAWLRGNGHVEVKNWTLAGNAEPTDNPDFPAVVASLSRLRNAEYPDVKLNAFTNGMGLVPRVNTNHEAALNALDRLDRPCLKLDAGIPDAWRRLARPVNGVELEEWLAGAERVREPFIQTMLVNGRIDNTSGSELGALKDRYARLRPKGVYVLTLNKPPADSRLRPVSSEKFKEAKEFLLKGLREGLPA